MICHMIKKNHLFLFSGLIWLLGSISLLPMGLRFLITASNSSKGIFSPEVIKVLGGETQALVAMVSLACCVGLLKGNFVLRKAALRSLKRIKELKAPYSLKNLYTPSYLVLLLVMVLLGVLMRVLGVPLDVRGFIDVAVGSALFRGSFFYFTACCDKNITCGI
jgi:hypothetical protein